MGYIDERLRTKRVAFQKLEREGLSPAESRPEVKECEVHSGVDSANSHAGTVAGYGEHPLHASSERLVNV